MTKNFKDMVRLTSGWWSVERNDGWWSTTVMILRFKGLWKRWHERESSGERRKVMEKIW
uniref:Uncharacterized protein n=1 Tax=Cucumis melo TaxID=3656 RepID=A0A9I9EDZ3_CUCME